MNVRHTTKSADFGGYILQESNYTTEKWLLPSGKYIGVMTLDNPKTMNTLTTTIMDGLTPVLKEWDEDPTITALYLRANGEKAFCAGGNIRQVRDVIMSCKENGSDPEQANELFSKEYEFISALQNFSKPKTCWVQGFALGAGMGLVQACSHRILATNAELAMPEVLIGFFPDSGAAWFLGKLPRAWARFFALTGSRMEASDAILFGLGDFITDAHQKENFENSLKSLDLTGDNRNDNDRIHALCNQYHKGIDPSQTKVAIHWEFVHELFSGGQLSGIVNEFKMKDLNEPWLITARANLVAASRLSLTVTDAYLKRTRGASVEEVLQSDKVLATCFCHTDDFPEGVRALLVDKDRTPKWQYERVSLVPREKVKNFIKQSLQSRAKDLDL